LDVYDVADHVRRYGWILLAGWYREFSQQ
jgi:hypothetical protein